MANRYGAGMGLRDKHALLAAYMNQQPTGRPLTDASGNIMRALMYRKMMKEAQAEATKNEQAQQGIARALMGGGNPQNVEAAMFNQQNPGDLQMVQTSPQKLPDTGAALQQAMMNPQALEANPMLAQVMMQQMAPQEAYNLAPGTVRMQGNRVIARNPGEGSKPSNLEQMLALTGLQPGSPEYQQAALDYISKPGVSIDMSDKFGPVPAGYRRVPDKSSPTGSKIEPEPGGPLDQEYNAKYRDLYDTESSFTLLSEALDEVGKIEGAFTGEGKGRLGTAYGNARSSIRKLYETGVLQPGELPMLEEALANPNSLSSLVDPRSRKMLRAQIKELNNLLGVKKRSLAEQYGKGPTDEALNEQELEELERLRKKYGRGNAE